MGMGLDLIDRGIYQVDPELQPSKLQTAADVQALKEKIEELRISLLDDRDQFLLSDSNTWVDPSKRGEKLDGEGNLPTKLPAKHRLIHRKGNWGRNMKDQLAVRDVSELEGYEEQIITTADKNLKAKHRENAIQRIEKRFAASKNLRVGIEKIAGSGVYAAKVMEFLPMMRLIPNQFTMTVCDDIIEDELRETSKVGKNPSTNDFMITEVPPEYLDEILKDERRGVLYRYLGTDQLPDDVLDSTLGKKRKLAPNSQLE